MWIMIAATMVTADFSNIVVAVCVMTVVTGLVAMVARVALSIITIVSKKYCICDDGYHMSGCYGCRSGTKHFIKKKNKYKGLYNK